MAHQYSFTDRMQTLFVGGSVLLVVLVFALGLVVGHLWWPLTSPQTQASAPRAQQPKLAPAAAPAHEAAAPPQPKEEKTFSTPGPTPQTEAVAHPPETAEKEK